MPTYSYRCADCEHAFDIHQSFTDDTLTICPNCGGTLRKVFSPVGVSFSGSGFYRTDSRAEAKGNSKGSSSSEGSSGGSESSSKSESASSSKAASSDSSPKKDSAPKTESKPAAKKESRS